MSSGENCEQSSSSTTGEGLEIADCHQEAAGGHTRLSPQQTGDGYVVYLSCLPVLIKPISPRPVPAIITITADTTLATLHHAEDGGWGEGYPIYFFKSEQITLEEYHDLVEDLLFHLSEICQY